MKIAEETYKLESEIIKKQLELRLISEKEYNEGIIKIKNEYNEKINKINEQKQKEYTDKVTRALESEEKLAKKRIDIERNLAVEQAKTQEEKNRLRIEYLQQDIDIIQKELDAMDKTLENIDVYNNKLIELLQKQYEYKKLINENENMISDKRKMNLEKEFEYNKKMIEAQIDMYKNYHDKRTELLRNELELTEKNIQIQEKLMEKMLPNTLFEQLDKREELEKMIQAQRERQQRIEEARQLANIFYETYLNKIKTGDTNALNESLQATMVAKGIAIALKGGLYEGSEYVEEKHAISVLPTQKDNLLVRLHKGERVISASENALLRGISNKELVNKVINDNKQVDTSVFINKIEELKKTIQNKREYTVDWDDLGNRIEQIVENGQKVIIKKMNKKYKI